MIELAHPKMIQTAVALVCPVDRGETSGPASAVIDDRATKAHTAKVTAREDFICKSPYSFVLKALEREELQSSESDEILIGENLANTGFGRR
jgi:hypothetical protein